MPNAPSKRDIREELHSYFLTQAISGKQDDRTLVRAFRVMSAVTFTLAPLGLLLYFQIKFLPFHDEGTTWLHRVCVLADAGLLLSIGAFPRKPQQPARLTRREFSRQVLLPRSPSVLAALFSLLVATFPHEVMDELMTATILTAEVPIPCSAAKPSLHRREAFWPTAWLFERKAYPEESRGCSAMGWLSGSRNLDVADLDLVPDKQVVDGEASLRLRNRNLRYADFSHSDLKYADFSDVDLRDSDLSWTTLSYASLVRAELQGANLYSAQLQGADLHSAQLWGAWLNEAKLQGANLSEAELQGAKLYSAVLQGANLYRAQLQGARLDGAQLQGANLFGAQFQGAYLIQAQLQGANLGFPSEGVNLGIDLSEDAKLNRVIRLRALNAATSLQGANLFHAQFQGANLDNAQFQGADLRSAQLQGASLFGAQFQGALLTGAQLRWNDAPGIEAFEHSDTSGFRFIARQDVAWFSDLQRLSSEMTATKTPGHKEVAASVERLAKQRDQASGEAKSKGRMGEKAFCALTALNEREDRPKERGEYLGDLACGDKSENAYIAKSLLWSQDSPAQAKAFLDKLTSCPAITAKLSAVNLKKLDDRAKEPPKIEARAKWDRDDGISTEKARAICKRHARKSKPARQ